MKQLLLIAPLVLAVSCSTPSTSSKPLTTTSSNGYKICQASYPQTINIGSAQYQVDYSWKGSTNSISDSSNITLNVNIKDTTGSTKVSSIKLKPASTKKAISARKGTIAGTSGFDIAYFQTTKSFEFIVTKSNGQTDTIAAPANSALSKFTSRFVDYTSAVDNELMMSRLSSMLGNN